MKKFLVLAALVLTFVLVLGACGNGNGGDGEVAIPADGEAWTGTLNIWSFTDEAERQAIIFQGMHPEVNVEFQMVGMDGGAYEEWVLTALAAGGANVPDVIYLEAGFVRAFVMGHFLDNLNDLLPLAREIEMYQFVIDIGSYEGEVRAFSWQATPGVMYYRRSIAEEVFGTSDPAAIQNYFRDLDTTIESARRIRDVTNGSAFFVGHPGEMNAMFVANREDPWIVNNRLVIDPMMIEQWNFGRILFDEGLQTDVTTWSENWFASMRDEFFDAEGNQRRIFAHFLPTWGLTHVIQSNAPDSSGDWAIIPGPLGYSQGGTWMGIPQASNNPQLAREFIRSTVLNPEFLSNWALGVYDNAYLRAIDPTIPEGVTQGGGDFVSSAVVAGQIADQFYGTPVYHFVGGQNPYTVFAQAAPYIDLRNLQGTDAAIGGPWADARTMYLEGLGTMEESLQFFRDNVQMVVPGLDW